MAQCRHGLQMSATEPGALGQELSPEEEAQHADFPKAAKIKELTAWKKFDVHEPRRNGNVPKQIAQTRWVLTWKAADGQRSVKARLAAEGYWDPALQEGLVETSGCISIRSPHLQMIPPSARETKWKLRRMEIMNRGAVTEFGNLKRRLWPERCASGSASFAEETQIEFRGIYGSRGTSTPGLNL